MNKPALSFLLFVSAALQLFAVDAQKGDRAIRETIGGRDHVWRISAASMNAGLVSVLSYSISDKGKSTVKYIIVARPGEALDLRTMLMKAVKWTDAARSAKAENFEKALGTHRDIFEWKFRWDANQATIFTGEYFVHEQDFAKLLELLELEPDVISEKKEMMKSAEEFSRTLR